MIPGTSLSAKACNCNEPVVESHACCSADIVQESNSCAQCECDMSHSIAISPLKVVSSQALHVRTQHINPQRLITKTKTIPLFKPPNLVS